MTAATNRRNRRAQARTRRRAGASWTPRAARQRRADTTTFTYSGPMFLTAVDGPSGRLATYVYDSESKPRRIYEGAAFTTIGCDYLQSYAGSKTLDYHTVEGLILAQRMDEDYAEYLPDFLGTVVAYADESGTALTEARYKPYGLPLWSDGPVEDYAFGWVGQWGYRDVSSLFRYVRLRQYLASEAVWLSRDPLWPWTHAFGYVSGRPVTVQDPLGLWEGDGVGGGYQVGGDPIVGCATFTVKLPFKIFGLTPVVAISSCLSCFDTRCCRHSPVATSCHFMSLGGGVEASISIKDFLAIEKMKKDMETLVELLSAFLSGLTNLGLECAFRTEECVPTGSQDSWNLCLSGCAMFGSMSICIDSADGPSVTGGGGFCGTPSICLILSRSGKSCS